MANLGDLSDILFAQIEELQNAKEKDLDSKIRKSRAIVDIAETIISNGELATRVLKLQSEKLAWGERDNIPKMLGGESTCEKSQKR